MPVLSDNPMWEAFGTRALYHAAYGGSDFGECSLAVARTGDGGPDAWHREWTAIADALVAGADAGADAGRTVSAREAYTRAATYYRTGAYPLFGSPIDERLRAANAAEMAALAKAVALADPPAEMVEIPFEGRSLPGVFARARGAATGERRPTVIYTNGYDSTIAEMWVAHVPAAVERGYHVLLYDGPGQGRSLLRDGLTLRPDWESVVAPVVDVALARPEVDPARIVLAGWSLGGFLAPRAAGREPRIAALVADPGQWDQKAAFLPRLPLSDDEKASFPDGVDPARLAAMDQSLAGPGVDPMLAWRLQARARMVHGTATLFEYFADMARFEVSPVAGDIRCPTLLTMADGDPISAGAPVLLDAIAAERKTLIRFTEADGAGGHCEGTARRLYHQRVYDWLDETLAG